MSLLYNWTPRRVGEKGCQKLKHSKKNLQKRSLKTPSIKHSSYNRTLKRKDYYHFWSHIQVYSLEGRLSQWSSASADNFVAVLILTDASSNPNKACIMRINLTSRSMSSFLLMKNLGDSSWEPITCNSLKARGLSLTSTVGHLLPNTH